MFSGVLVSTVPSDGWIRGTARQKINHVLKTGWQMTHWAIWPQFMCSLHRFTHKKGIFRCNKRLWHCNPTIVSLSLKFSVDCFHETKRPIESKIEIYSKLIQSCPTVFSLHVIAQTYWWPKSTHICPKVPLTDDIFPSDPQTQITNTELFQCKKHVVGSFNLGRYCERELCDCFCAFVARIMSV